MAIRIRRVPRTSYVGSASEPCLETTKRNQVVALGPVGWTLRRIEEATGVRTRDGQRPVLRNAGIAIRKPRWSKNPNQLQTMPWGAPPDSGSAAVVDFPICAREYRPVATSGSFIRLRGRPTLDRALVSFQH